MKNSDKAYVQAYNALAAVDGANQIIVACEVSDNPADNVVLESFAVTGV